MYFSLIIIDYWAQYDALADEAVVLIFRLLDIIYEAFGGQRV